MNKIIKSGVIMGLLVSWLLPVFSYAKDPLPEVTQSNINKPNTDPETGITADEQRQFDNAINYIKNYARTHTVSDQNTEEENNFIKSGNQLIQLEKAYERVKQCIERNLVKTNYNQEFTNWLQAENPREAMTILSATNGPWLAKQQAYTNQFIQIKAMELKPMCEQAEKIKEKSDESYRLLINIKKKE